MTREEYREYSSSFTREDLIRIKDMQERFYNSVYSYVGEIEGYDKLPKAQQEIIKGLVFKMAKVYVGDDYIINHYEIFNDNTIEDPIYEKYRIEERNNIYLSQGNSSSFRALEKKGFIKYVKDAGRGIDRISPLFTVDFTGLI